METLTVLLCLSIFAVVQAKPSEIQLSHDEEECLCQTGVSREVVLKDKIENQSSSVPKNDPKFTDFINCYAEKLERAGKLHYTKDVAVNIPGYKTKKFLPEVYCTEDELSGKVPLVRQCALPLKPVLGEGKAKTKM